MPSTDTILCFEGYRLDRAHCTLQWRDEPLVITRRSFELLTYLAEHPNRLLTKDALLEAVWPDQFVEESNLTQHVFLLRKALAKHGETRLIETVPGRGYRFNAIVEEQQRPAESHDVLPVVEPSTVNRTNIAPKPSITPQADTKPTANVAGRALELTAVHALYGRQILPQGGRRWWPWLVFTALALVTTGAWAFWRWQNAPGGPPVQIVLMPVDGTTGDPVLDRALSDALRIDLLQSPWVTTLPEATVRLTLERMQRNPDSPLDAATAREVCERTNSQAVLQSELARIGTHFLFTAEATSCVDGSTLAAARQEASRAESLPAALAAATGTLRRKLGESRSSIARFSTPIVASDRVNAKSLEALELDSQAKFLGDAGKHVEAIELLKRAVAIEPEFADAWFTLYTEYIVTGDPAEAYRSLQKAYDLRAGASPMLKLALAASFDAGLQGDLDAAERDYREWIELYPRYSSPYNGLYTVLARKGDGANAAPLAEKVLAMEPSWEASYYNAAGGELLAGHLDQAKRRCQDGIAAGYDTDLMHDICLRIAVASGDKALEDRQWDWLAAHPRSPMTLAIRSDLAMSEGRFKDAWRYIEDGISGSHEEGQTASDNIAVETLAFGLLEAGETDRARAMVRAVQLDPDNGDHLVMMAALGDDAKALHLFAALKARHPHDTVILRWQEPSLRAHVALNEHRPREAMEVLRGTEIFNFSTEDLRRLRARADLEAGEFKTAEAEYRDILAHPEIDPSDMTHKIAWLGLGRALAGENRQAEAVEAYRRFLDLWAHADPGAVLVTQARTELAALQR